MIIKHSFHKKTKKTGFTIVEVLIVVVILSLLSAIAIPNVISMQKNLRIMELDESARSIYAAVQNRMSEMHVSGELASVSSNGTNKELSTEELSYLDKGAANAILPLGAIESVTNNGCYYIEYYKDTGIVSGVFYSDESFEYSGDLPRDKSVRVKNNPMLGYYGEGSSDSGESEESTTPKVTLKSDPPDFEIVNGEELYISLKASDGHTYTVSIKDSASNEEIKYTLSSSFPNESNIDFDNNEYIITLDSYKNANMQYKDIFTDATYGSDFSVSVKSQRTEDENGETLEPPAAESKAVTKSGNSLFAVYNKSKKEIQISNLRHFQNLSSKLSGFNYMDVESVILNIDVDINKVNDVVSDFPSLSFSGMSVKSFDGKNHSITNLKAAFFDEFNSGSIKNIALVNPKINSDRENTGVLVNTAKGVTLTNCFVYDNHGTAADSSITAKGPVAGGLIGYATNCDIVNCNASLIQITVSGSTGYVGGLVGKMDGGTIKDSYAATGYWNSATESWRTSGKDVDCGIILSNGYAGGLIGYANGASASNSYAVGNISITASSDGNYANGFAGGTVDAKNCYCAVTFKGTEKAYINGFSASNAENNGKNCYYLKNPAVNGNKAGATPLIEMRSKISTPGSGWPSGVSTANTYGRTPSDLYPYTSLRKHYGDWPDEEQRKAYSGVPVYFEIYTDGSYGFDIAECDQLLADGSAGITAVMDGYAILMPKGEEAPGFKWNISAGSGTGKYLYNNTAFATIKVTDPDSSDVTEYDAYAIDLSSIAATANADEFYTKLTVGNDTDTYWFNPMFAKTVSDNTTKPQKPDTIYIRTARHLAQLSAIKNGTDYGNPIYYNYFSCSFEQELNIDFRTYKSDYSSSYSMTLWRIGAYAAERQFSGQYDGNYYYIAGTGIQYPDEKAVAYVGLFGGVSKGGVLKNIIFISDPEGKESFSIEGKTQVGALVGRVEGGTIENCFTAGFNVKGIGSSEVDYIGGFAGMVWDSTVKNCGVANYSINGIGGSVYTSDGTTYSMATFAGAVYNGSSLEDCYGIATLAGNVSKDVKGIFTKRIVITNNKTVRFTNCYSMAFDEKDNVINYPFVPAVSNTVVTNCVSFNGKNLDDITNNFSWDKPTESNTFPFADQLKGKPYPYPSPVDNASGASIHYGNWPTNLEPLKNEGLYYYEKYSDGKYGYYSEDFNPGSLSDTLDIVADGYVVISKGTSDSINVTATEYRGWNAALASGSISRTEVNMGGETFSAYYITPDSALMNGTPINSLSIYDMQKDYLELEIKFSDSSPSKTYYFNPNFAKTAAAEMPSASPSQFEIRTARQLAHLGKMTASVNTGTSTAISPYISKNYVVTRNIDFSKYLTKYEYMPIGANRDFTGTFDGKGYVISGLNITTCGDLGAVGLFGVIASDGKVQNVILKADKTGYSISSSNNHRGTGGLAGENNGTITNCAVSGYTITANEGNVGGFVGVNKGTIANCSAANGYFGDDAKGGYISREQYSGDTGGFAGSNSGNIYNCYAVARILYTQGNKPYGFAGNTSGGSITSSYCASVNYEDYEYLAFAPSTPDTCMALEYDNFDTLKNFSSGSWKKADESHSYPYSDDLTGAYPFPAVVKNNANEVVHYGNWPVFYPYMKYEGLYYYEKYTDETYGYYAKDLDVSTLSDTKAVLEDGYVVLSYKDAAKVSVTATEYTSSKSTNPVEISDPVTVKMGDFNYYAYYLKPSSDVMYSPTTYGMHDNYLHLKIEFGPLSSKTYYFNPNFAKTSASRAKPSESISSFEIRTARQLRQLGVMCEITSSGNSPYLGKSYLVSRNIDFNAYSPEYRSMMWCMPIGANAGFTGTFDGGGYVISGLDIDIDKNGSSGARGLFGVIGSGGTVENILLIADKDGNTISNTKDDGKTGALAGINNGTIRNCAVAGYTITATRGNVGGFVGINNSNGIITNCSAANGYFDIVRSGGVIRITGAGNIGGFAGSNYGTISSCYAMARLEGNSYAQPYGFAGASASSATITHSYCASVNAADDMYTPFYIGGTPATCFALTYETYASLEAFTGGELKEVDKSYPYTTELKGQYPFPAVVENNANDVVHYGNWPIRYDTSLVAVHLAYYEIYENKSGYPKVGFKCDELNLNTLSTTSEKILRVGYCLMFDERTDLSKLDSKIEYSCVNPEQSSIIYTGTPSHINQDNEFTKYLGGKNPKATIIDSGKFSPNSANEFTVNGKNFKLYIMFFTNEDVFTSSNEERRVITVFTTDESQRRKIVFTTITK